ncbi:unnamed protein product [Absidia cylindrospora]
MAGKITLVIVVFISETWTNVHQVCPTQSFSMYRLYSTFCSEVSRIVYSFANVVIQSDYAVWNSLVAGTGGRYP